jgi:DNA gyrase subunit A
MGRATQGVKLIDLRGNDEIAAVTKVKREDEEEEGEVQYDEDGNPIPVEPSEPDEAGEKDVE